MNVQVTNNSPFPVYVDVNGDGSLENTHILGPKAKETLDFATTEQIEAVRAEFGSNLILKVMG